VVGDRPGSDKAVMGPYYPKVHSTTKEKFEAAGMKK
jgi:hypothetical protein